VSYTVRITDDDPFQLQTQVTVSYCVQAVQTKKKLGRESRESARRRFAKFMSFVARFCFLLFFSGCGASNARPAKSAPMTDADRVLVVINKRSTAGDSVGRYYMKRRGIAPNHLVLVDVPVADEITAGEYESRIESPIRAAIESLTVRIDFIVLTTGTPIRIGGRAGNSVDAMLSGMNLNIPPMVGFDSVWLSKYRSPYFASRERFSSDRFSMYLVTRLDCGMLSDCIALVDRSIVAQPVRGPFFLDATPLRVGKDSYSIMNRSLYGAAARLQSLGLQPLLDSASRFVAPAEPVMGYASWGSNDARFDSSAYHAVRFLPGALAETFVSTSARTFGPTAGGQSRIVDLIAQGVTGVKGYVSEPYTFALANPEILFDRYVHGFTLAESFYAASRMVFWKDIIIGDPLCAPYPYAPIQ